MMRRTLNPTHLANLRFERAAWYSEPGHQPRQTVGFQPAGVRLDNDGSHTHWMAEAEDYYVEHDGTGWRVTAHGGPRNHIYRLADASGPYGSYVSALPGEAGPVELVPGTVYHLRHDGARLTLSTL